MELWIRLGDAGDYQAFDGLADAIDYLNELSAGEITAWTTGPYGVGFDTVNYWGEDFISCFWGDADANLIRALDRGERVVMENGLVEAYV